MGIVESETVELKRQYVDTIAKSVVAFANTAGGVIYVGIEDDGQVIGLDNGDNDLLRVTNLIRDTICPDVTLFTKAICETIDGKTVIKIAVEKGTSSPYYLRSKGIRPEGVYVRQGTASVPASGTAIRNMIKTTDGDKYEDSRSLEQELTFQAAEKEFGLRKVPFGTQQMRTLKLISPSGIYTNLALLLSDQCMHTIKMAVFQGGTKETFRTRIELEGSILKQMNEAYEFLDRYNQLHAEIRGLYRVDTRDYPEEALRESLLNTIVHREYSLSGSTLISIFDNRIEFISLGGLALGITLNDALFGVSLSRNEHLANVFYRLELIEAFGTGIPKMLRSYEGQPVKPLIETSDNAFKITLPNINNPVISSEDPLLTPEEKAVLELAQTDGFVRQEVEKALGIRQGAATRLIRKMLEAKLLKTSGKGKNVRYYRN